MLCFNIVNFHRTVSPYSSTVFTHCTVSYIYPVVPVCTGPLQTVLLGFCTLVTAECPTPCAAVHLSLQNALRHVLLCTCHCRMPNTMRSCALVAAECPICHALLCTCHCRMPYTMRSCELVTAECPTPCAPVNLSLQNTLCHVLLCTCHCRMPYMPCAPVHLSLQNALHHALMCTCHCRKPYAMHCCALFTAECPTPCAAVH